MTASTEKMWGTEWGAEAIPRSMNIEGPRVGIIGAGVSGLAACKHLSQREVNVTVLETKSGLGGLWRDTYASTALQTSRRLFEFSDFPWPESASEFPMHNHVMEYLEGYAEHFGLLDKMQFNCQVVQIRRGSSVATEAAWDEFKMDTGGLRSRRDGNLDSNEWSAKQDMTRPEPKGAFWEVRARKKISSSSDSPAFSEERLEFDYLVISCGCFGDIPNVPSYPALEGPDVFMGQVLHSLDYSTLGPERTKELINGKKVVIVGYGKTALDIAVEVANSNEAAGGGAMTLLFRRTHWLFPHKIPMAFGYIPFMYLVYTRFGELFAPKPNQGIIQQFLQRIVSPVKWLMWKTVEYDIRSQVPLSMFGLVPEHSLSEDISGCMIPGLPVGFAAHLENGRIVPVKTPSFSFYPQGVRLANGTQIEADVVLLCTGYKAEEKLKTILPAMAREFVFETEDALSLYRGLIHPKIPNMAFLGYREGLSCTHSAELGATWLAHLIKGEFCLPDLETMEAERLKWLQYKKRITPFYKRPCVGTIEIWHFDTLCKDIGMTSNAQKQSWWQALFSMLNIKNYKLTD